MNLQHRTLLGYAHQLANWPANVSGADYQIKPLSDEKNSASISKVTNTMTQSNTPATNNGNTNVQWRGFLIALLLGTIILGSWICPVSRIGWDAVDRAVFFFLNGSVATPSLWSHFWAVMNSRTTDLAPLLLLLPFLAVPDLLIQRTRRITACCHLLIILIIMLVVRFSFEQITDILHWRGNSPTLTLQPAHLLSDMYPALNPKDTSNQSFPGDHSGVLMIVASFLLLQGTSRWNWFIGGVAVFFMLPRLIAGAHWFTDVAVGGLFIASTSMAIGFFTPWPLAWATELGARIYQHPLTPPWMR
jgi:membrane-associated phospholipid phosphatase